MALRGFPIMRTQGGPPIGWAAGAIDHCGDGRGYPMNHGDGCLTIMGDGIMQVLDGAGFRDHPLASTSGLLHLCVSITAHRGFLGAL